MTIQERIDALTANRATIEAQYADATAAVFKAIEDGLLAPGGFSDVCERGEITIYAESQVLTGDLPQDRLDQVKQALDDCRKFSRANIAHQLAIELLQQRLPSTN